MRKITAVFLLFTVLASSLISFVHAEGYEPPTDPEALFAQVFSREIPLTDEDVARFIEYDNVSYFDEDGNVRYFNNRNAYYFTTDGDGYALFQSDPEAFYSLFGLRYAPYGSAEYGRFADIWYEGSVGVTGWRNGERYETVEYKYFLSLPYFEGYSSLGEIDKLYFEAKVWNAINLASASAPFILYAGIIGDELIPGVCPATNTDEYYNDINYDGAFNIKDLTYFKRYIVGIESRINFAAADRNKDGAVTVKDLASMKRTLAGSTPSAGDEVTGINYVYLKAENAHLERKWYESWKACLLEGARSDKYKAYIENFFGAEGGIISSYDEYAAFRDGMPFYVLRETGPVTESDGLTYVYRYYFALPDLDDWFFENNVLAVGYVFSPCCNYTHTVDDVSVNGDTVTVNVTEHIPEGMGLTAIEEYALLVALTRDFAGSADSLSVVKTVVDENQIQ